PRRARHSFPPRRSSDLVLSLAAYKFTEFMGSEYRASVRTHDTAQARACAISGIYYAAAMLADPDQFYGALGGNPYDNASAFADQDRKSTRLNSSHVAIS